MHPVQPPHPKPNCSAHIQAPSQGVKCPQRSTRNLKLGKQIMTEPSCSKEKGWLPLCEIPGHLPVTEVQRKLRYLRKL